MRVAAAQPETRGLWARRQLRAGLFQVALLGATTAVWSPSLSAQTAPPPSFFEFGTVVSQTKSTVDLQTFDPQRQRIVQHTFSLTRETLRPDAVHVGDSVEVIYVAGAASGERILRRLILLPSGVPTAGPPPDSASAGSIPASQPHSGVSATSVSSTLPADTLPAGTVPAVRAVTIPRGTPPAAARPSTAATTAGQSVPTKNTAPAPHGGTVSLGAAGTPTVPKVSNVALGAPAGSINQSMPTARSITQSRPSEECNRSSADWPTQPVRIAVIDFRYPTEREEAHDVGTTGGGSGTAVADLIFARMEALEQTDPRFAFSRGDRRRLDRSDFAGAARLGRQLGVDAVLAGTFFPVETPAPKTSSSDPYAPPTITYELRAGVVDTCTGQLLMRLSSVACPQALSPGLDAGLTGAGIEPCTRFAVPAQDASDPRKYAQAFRPLLDAMLYPVEHNGTPVKNGKPEAGSAGLVTAVNGPAVSVRLPAGVRLKTGEQIAIHAWRLAKSPATYTLHDLQDEEIGRVVLTRVDGTNVQGDFTGDYPPLPGDPAELLPTQ